MLCLYCRMLTDTLLVSDSAEQREDARLRLHTHVKAEHEPLVTDSKIIEGVGL